MASGRANYTQEWLNAEPLTSIAPDEEFGYTAAEVDPDENDYNQGLATRLYLLSREGLQRLCRRKKGSSPPKSSLSTLKEELGKLYLWGEAFENGKLDKALELSEDLRDTVLELLCAIGDTITRALLPYPTLTVESAATPKHIQDLVLLIDQAKSITFSNGNQMSTETSEDEEEYGASEDGTADRDTDIVGDLQFHIACLVDLGSTLEKSLLCTESARVRSVQVAAVPFHASDAARVYISLVRDKFKDADARLVERLGEANWQRHVNVRLRMEELFNGVEGEYIREDPCSTFRPYSAFHDSGIGPSVPAQAQYAASHTSLVSSISEREEGRLRVPREPPEVADGKPFQCYICGEILSRIRNRVDWKFHVYADLQPYICTFANCEDELVQFSNRAAWADHEFTKHRVNRFWTCPECPEKSSTAVDWATHLVAVHQRAFSGPNVEVARDMAYNTELRPVENEECPFCRVILKRPRRAFIKHVGSHMEEIALMALPRDRLSDLDDESVIRQEGSIETSRLPASNDFTQNNSLPGLSGVGSSRSHNSVSDGIGERQMNRNLRIMVPDSGGALDPIILPPLRRPYQDPLLECPFIFLKCFRQFPLSNGHEWIRHSLEHFRVNRRGPRMVDPPKTNSCCFCSQTFQASSGVISWRNRMVHVKLHHLFGHRLAAARHDFVLVEYLWQNGLLSPADYRNLKPSTAAPVEIQHIHPPSMRTSRLPASNDSTQNNSRPDVSSAGSSKAPDPPSDGMGETQTNRALRNVIPDSRSDSAFHDSDVRPPIPDLLQYALAHTTPGVDTLSSGPAPPSTDPSKECTCIVCLGIEWPKEGKLHHCPVENCHFSSERWKNLLRHTTVKHCNNTPYKYACPVVECRHHGEGNGFTRKDNLSTHLRRVHESTRREFVPNFVLGSSKDKDPVA